jgi:hypothetical protein
MAGHDDMHNHNLLDMLRYQALNLGMNSHLIPGDENHHPTVMITGATGDKLAQLSIPVHKPNDMGRPLVLHRAQVFSKADRTNHVHLPGFKKIAQSQFSKAESLAGMASPSSENFKPFATTSQIQGLDAIVKSLGTLHGMNVLVVDPTYTVSIGVEDLKSSVSHTDANYMRPKRHGHGHRNGRHGGP